MDRSSRRSTLGPISAADISLSLRGGLDDSRHSLGAATATSGGARRDSFGAAKAGADAAKSKGPYGQAPDGRCVLIYS